VSRPDPFRIAIPQAELDDLRARLAATRWPDAVAHDWRDGTDADWLRALCDYWADGFDWRAQEADLNRFPHYRLDLGGRRLHFLHAPSPHPDAAPLVLLHGWPGSFVEFRRMIDALVDPPAHGGDAADAFEVVVPSLAGFGFSDAPDSLAFHSRAMADDVRRLMATLGFERYFAQGGDLGSSVATWLAADDPACAGIHLNLVFSRRPRDVDDPLAGVGEAERARLAASAARVENGLGYQQIQGTKPQSLGYALNDSPAGLAGWILEKFHGWAQHDGDPFSVIDRDDALTNVSVYWFTRTITSACRMYYAHRQHPPDPPMPERVETPTAVAVFPGELYLPPRAWVERQYHLVHWAVQERGGHFAALEAPAALTADVRTALRPLR
jgi:microsomal epoxide hydrolase